MISNYARQKESMQARIDIKTRETMLENIIVKGTDCSPFESEIIVNKAKEVFCNDKYSETRTLNPGQVGLAAVDKCPGKEISKHAMKHVVLTNIISKKDKEVWLQHGLGAKLQVQILRMTIEAMEQGALTREDLSHRKIIVEGKTV
jgi:hypothetical protein